MAPRTRVIIDTDPGVDDVLALLLALSASPEELEVMMISVTYGNVPRHQTLHNVVSLFHVLEKELEWRRANAKAEGFETMRSQKPIVAVGPEHALEDETLMADHFHGVDGLHGVHEQHPHLSPAGSWKEYFDEAQDSTDGEISPFFTPCTTPAHQKILQLLRDNPPDTISIIAIGPMTNLALAAAEDTETFLRAKEVVVMGGAINVAGNITPVAEFNCYADAVATARVFALTSPTPSSTMPPIPEKIATLPPYPENLSRPLKLTLFPLDITLPHLLNRNYFAERMLPIKKSGSPLALWVDHFMTGTFNKIESILGNSEEPGLSLHDPITVWYLMTISDPGWRPVETPEDVRVETCGQWCRGMQIVDRRTRAKVDEEDPSHLPLQNGDVSQEVPKESSSWLSIGKGNRINRMIDSPDVDGFAEYLMKRIFE